MQKVGHNAKVCRMRSSTQYIKDDVASSAEENNWAPDKIHSITEQINTTAFNGKPRSEFYTKRL